VEKNGFPSVVLGLSGAVHIVNYYRELFHGLLERGFVFWPLPRPFQMEKMCFLKAAAMCISPES